MNEPLVSILTPVYNGEEFLSDCIESVLTQDYQNWEYHIVNNRSTDATLQIAEAYAAKDSRIRISTNETFLSMPENFNMAFSKVPAASRYFKVVCADDWILPRCLSKMVDFATSNPSVGILCCHQESGSQVRWQELPPSVTKLSGREACRLALLKGLKLFGAPTAFLYQSDLLRLGKPFFPNNRPHSDTSACYEFLNYCDYGVVHEILAVERVHGEQISSQIEPFAAGDVAYLEVLLEYGPRYLTETELRSRRREVFDAYYRFLGGAFLKWRSGAFWDFQRSRLRELGCELEWARVINAAIAKSFREVRNPVVAMRKALSVLRRTAA